MNAEKILVLAPHTDDGEFGCGASIAKFIEEGKEIFYVAFSTAEKSVPKGMPTDILHSEVRDATGTLGISQDKLFVLKYPVREFPKYRQDILEDMIRLGREIQPDMIMLPSTSDTHQDHQIILQEGFRAFKKTTMLGYEIPWNNLTFNTNAFIFLEQRHLDVKINALKCYISQLGRSYVTEEFIRSLAITRGGQIGTKYAETFEVIRWIMDQR
jgi:LmbE family N-acetylglucosaminyl deacetylase